MRILTRSLILMLFCAHSADAQHDNFLQPTELETWVYQDGTSVIDEREIGRIVEGDTTAVFSALKLAIPLHPPGVIAGLKLELSDAQKRDTVYLERARLDRLSRVFKGMHDGADEMLANRATQSRTHGMEECVQQRSRQTLLHVLCAQFSVSAASDGLSMYTFKEHSWRFPGHRPIELLQMIDGVIEEIDQ